MVVLLFLFHDRVGEFFEVCHYEWVDHLDVFIILCRQVILHERDLLSQHINLFLEVAELALTVLDHAVDPLDALLY